MNSLEMRPDFSLRTWVDVHSNNGFPIQNLPFGVARFSHGNIHACSRIGDFAIDLAGLYRDGLLPVTEITASVLKQTTLNTLIGLGKGVTNGTRQALTEVLKAGTGASIQSKVSEHLYPLSEVQMQLPIAIGDYTDFYSSEEHARNVGSMFRDPENALMPNWKHLPVGYHGRSSSIVVSGTDIKRPQGQTKPADSAKPVYGTSKLLDFELEMGFVVGRDSVLGTPVSAADANDHIFGLALFNDWSARDIQKWEYVPLGPFLGKNFASSMSAWITPLEMLEPFRVHGPKQEPEVLDYLKYAGKGNYAIQLEVAIRTSSGSETVVSRSNFKYMYWSMAQQLAHHTVNGCNVRIGDFYASGTISGPDTRSYGSMLELTWQGKRPITLADGSERKFLNDGDTVIMRGWCERNGIKLAMGEVSGTIIPV